MQARSPSLNDYIKDLLDASKLKGLAAPLFILLMLGMMVLPLPAAMLDVMFTFNITLSLIVLVAALYTKRPLDFSSFPTVLLITTLLRLSLNVASTRVVLLHGHEGSDAAGKVIESFGHFLIGGNLAVGIIVFAILVVINFVVITAALSSCNAGIFSGGRLLYSLSTNGYAPASFAKLSRYGVPHRAVMATVGVCMSGVVLNYFVPDKAFQYIMAAVTFVGLMVWIAILFTQMKFRRSLTKAQVAELGYRAPWWPYSSWFALAFICLVVVLMGFHEDARIALILGPCLLGVYLVMFYIVGLHRKIKMQHVFNS